MPDLDHLRIDGTTYDLKDSTAREKDAVQDNELNSLKSALAEFYVDAPIYPTWAQGYIRVDGTTAAASDSCYSELFTSNGRPVTMVAKTGKKVKVAEYDANGTFIKLIVPLSAGTNIFTIPTGELYRVQISADSGALAPENAPSSIDCFISALTDATLTQSGKAADAKACGEALATKANAAETTGELADLESAIDELEELTTVTEGTSVTRDIINTVTWTSGYMGTNGTTGESSSMRYSNRFPVSKGDVVANLPDTKDFRFVCAFSGETPVSASGAQNVATYTVPDGIDGLVITSYISASQYAPTSITHTTTEYRAKNIYEDDIAELTTSVDTIEDAVIVEQYQEETETDITPVFADGFMSTDGTVNDTGSAAYFDHTQKISVQPGDVVTTWRDTNSYPMRFVCAFSGDSPVPSSGSSDEVTQFTVPEGIDGVVVSVRDSTNINTIKVIHAETQKAAYVKPIPMGFMVEQGSLSNGAAMVLPFHNVKNHNIYVFNANIQAFSKIKFSKESSTYVEVDSTNLIITNDQNTFTIPHGLTIANNITLMVCNETSTSVSLIRVSSNGQEFNYTTATRFIMDSGAPRIESVGSTLTECTFSWVSKNLNAPIWLFGDSYFSWYDNRWTYYLARDGYTKDCMLNGYAGEASADAYTALKNLLAVTTPKIVVWCMGMNDGDSTTAVSTNWLMYYEKLVNLSKKYGFEIVLYTVPTTPVINNQYKDAIIRSSGYRYIEADKAVRIDGNGNWIPGALNEGTAENPDNVHPTPMGAKIIYYRVLSDLPEIMCNY